MTQHSSYSPFHRFWGKFRYLLTHQLSRSLGTLVIIMVWSCLILFIPESQLSLSPSLNMAIIVLLSMVLSFDGMQGIQDDFKDGTFEYMALYPGNWLSYLFIRWCVHYAITSIPIAFLCILTLYYDHGMQAFGLYLVHLIQMTCLISAQFFLNVTVSSNNRAHGVFLFLPIWIPTLLYAFSLHQDPSVYHQLIGIFTVQLGITLCIGNFAKRWYQ